jgi:hypothetical protein
MLCSHPRLVAKLLATPSRRTHEKGHRCLSGLFGTAQLMRFRGEPGPDGIPTWNVYVQPGKEQEERALSGRSAGPPPQQQRREPDPDRPVFDDGIDDTGGHR